MCSAVWITKIKKNYDCDLFFSKDMDNDAEFIGELTKTTEQYDIVKYTKI
jgi:hypothetical protein